MKRATMAILLWVGITIPVTLLALVLDAYVAANLTYLTDAFVETLNKTTYIGRPLIVELTERFPEVIGMGAGMLIILITLWIARAERVSTHNR